MDSTGWVGRAYDYENQRSSGSRVSYCARAATFRANFKGWSARLDTWVRTQRFDNNAAQLAFDYYLQARAAPTVQLAANLIALQPCRYARIIGKQYASGGDSETPGSRIDPEERFVSRLPRERALGCRE